MSKNNKQESALNMAGFIKSQSLLLLGKLEDLNLYDLADQCEELHETAEQLETNLEKALKQ